MELNGRLGTIGKVTGVAATTAPLVRRLATDEDLRTDVSDFIGSANHLVRELASDKRLRKDIRRMMSAAQSGGEHIRQDVRPRGRSMFWLGLGMVAGVMAIAGALLYPRTRQSVMHAADQTMQKASATVHDVRGVFSRNTSGTSGEYAPAPGSTEYGETGEESKAA